LGEENSLMDNVEAGFEVSKVEEDKEEKF